MWVSSLDRVNELREKLGIAPLEELDDDVFHADHDEESDEYCDAVEVYVLDTNMEDILSGLVPSLLNEYFDRIVWNDEEIRLIPATFGR